MGRRSAIHAELIRRYLPARAYWDADQRGPASCSGWPPGVEQLVARGEREGFAVLGILLTAEIWRKLAVAVVPHSANPRFNPVHPLD